MFFKTAQDKAKSDKSKVGVSDVSSSNSRTSLKSKKDKPVAAMFDINRLIKLLFQLST